jgi:dolichyl-phosphate-mannose--protein O-mannosyl transferase
MGVVIIVSAAAVYTAGWAFHFALLTEPGTGDAWGVPAWEGAVLPDFVRHTAALHKTMYNANNGLTTAHHDSSPWWGWPFMSTPVFYWQSSQVQPPHLGAIYFIGNPVVWVGSTLLLLAAIAWMIMVMAKPGTVSGLRTSGFIIPLLGYAVSFWPLTRVDRGLFLYHYLTPLIFGVLLGVVWLDQRSWFNRLNILRQPARVQWGLALVVLFFVFFSPLTYGWPLDSDLQQLLFWFKNWR